MEQIDLFLKVRHCYIPHFVLHSGSLSYFNLRKKERVEMPRDSQRQMVRERGSKFERLQSISNKNLKLKKNLNRTGL